MRAREFIKADENVVAVLTGHLLKDTDYVNKYHTNTLEAEGQERIVGNYRNELIRVMGGREELRTILGTMVS
jgi:threonine synthase